jgi:hypothetical protein
LKLVAFFDRRKSLSANVLLIVNSNEILLQELSIALLKNTRQIVFEGSFESSMFLLTAVALESSLHHQGKY